MRIVPHFCLLIAASISMLGIAAASPAQSSGHGAQLVNGGTTTAPPLHGGAQGAWLAPGAGEGHVIAKLYDSQGIERFLLDGTLIQYQFLVAAPAQGEMMGELLVPMQQPGRLDQFDMKEVFAMVEGQWIETANGRGAFSASILAFGADADQQPVPIGSMQGTFQLIATAHSRPALTIQLAPGAPTIDADPAPAASALNHLSLTPPIEILLPGSPVNGAHGIELVRRGTQASPSNDHGGIGQVGPGGVASATYGSATPLPSRGRLALRWQLFE
jgi:hypothetical protein